MDKAAESSAFNVAHKVTIRCFNALDLLKHLCLFLYPDHLVLKISTSASVIVSTTIHAMTKLFVPLCSAQDG